MPFIGGGNREAAVEWSKRLRRSRLDAMERLTREFDRLLRETGRVPHAIREGLAADLTELRPWRNALCHGAWLDVDEVGCGQLEHLYPDPADGLPVAFEPRKIAPKNLSDLRARTVDVTIRVAEAASVSGPPDTGMAGASYTLAVEMPRLHEPRPRRTVTGNSISGPTPSTKASESNSCRVLMPLWQHMNTSMSLTSTLR